MVHQQANVRGRARKAKEKGSALDAEPFSLYQKDRQPQRVWLLDLVLAFAILTGLE
jgi:hypothetical protein